MRLGIIGGGRAAWAFGATWRRIGWPIAGVSLREGSPSPIASLLDAPLRTTAELANDAELLLLAISDRAIGELAASLPESRAIVFHPSGSLTAVRGGFSLHPLRALPAAGEPSDLRDTLLVFEGNHRDVARQIADATGARFAEIAPEKKAAYHAAAVFGSNYVALMLELARDLIGIDDVRDDLIALADSAIANWRTHDDAQRFTGPAARGDRETIERHLAALADRPELVAIYRLLADRILAARE
ncbi:MAG: hypothetical protein JWO97_2414 [Acidobacteria bacterium]|nr:hypothetical protein [Acidobacteriota bacterium]